LTRHLLCLALQAACGCPKWHPAISSNTYVLTSQAHKQKNLHKAGFFVYMARLKRFELLTARFVAEYSIQLSYRRNPHIKCGREM
jgi:hypothetical protein